MTGAKATWYGGGQLDNPACGGPRPSDNDLVVAASESSGIPCHSTVHIHYHGKMVSAKVVDRCAGCNAKWLDLTKGTFKKLAGLDVGELHGVHIRVFPA
ncbi:RlpA-like double-psi beta-barrel domain [Ceraceosorus bombacis]|uniref:RlpA-like double-psi beta-barrel domain n=1 Tax=Ceraceosorus bombacis TaxID=401625 RepID=A0A0N7LB66_9BASI|nr:RlpA-like double-psi beta-barrel domain [Ceraceosorus bombacis]